MSGTIEVIVGAAGAPWEMPLLRGLQRPELGVRVLRRCVEPGELLGTALRDRPRAVIVDAAMAWVDRDLVTTLRGAGIDVLSVGPARPDAALGVIALAADVDAVEVARVLD